MKLRTPAIILLGCCLAVPAAAFQASSQDLNDAFTRLKAAEEKKDIPAVKQIALECFDAASKVAAVKQPADESEVAAWKSNTGFAKEVLAYSEYALHVAVLRSTDPAQRVELFEALEKNRPNSEYVPKLYPVMLGVYSRMKPDRSFQFAQRAINRAPKDEDLLIVLASGAYERKQYDSAAGFANRLVSAIAPHARPDGTPAGDWESKRSAMLGRGHWLAGMSYAALNKYPQAAASLKASLPFLKGEPTLLAGAQFYIGVANYTWGRTTHDKPLLREALKYSEEAAAMKSPYQAMAQQNAYAIKQELLRIR